MNEDEKPTSKDRNFMDPFIDVINEMPEKLANKKWNAGNLVLSKTWDKNEKVGRWTSENHPLPQMQYVF
jgi:hypothetical protein